MSYISFDELKKHYAKHLSEYRHQSDSDVEISISDFYDVETYPAFKHKKINIVKIDGVQYEKWAYWLDFVSMFGSSDKYYNPQTDDEIEAVCLMDTPFCFYLYKQLNGDNRLYKIDSINQNEFKCKFPDVNKAKEKRLKRDILAKFSDDRNRKSVTKEYNNLLDFAKKINSYKFHLTHAEFDDEEISRMLNVFYEKIDRQIPFLQHFTSLLRDILSSSFYGGIIAASKKKNSWLCSFKNAVVAAAREGFGDRTMMSAISTISNAKKIKPNDIWCFEKELVKELSTIFFMDIEESMKAYYSTREAFFMLGYNIAMEIL